MNTIGRILSPVFGGFLSTSPGAQASVVFDNLEQGNDITAGD
jgi:hypothetical protein